MNEPGRSQRRRGETRVGEGLIGLAWSFMNAGARGVAVSQWKVGSNSTAELTTEFYRNLQRSASLRKADALRQASLRLRRTPRTGHPFYWAGFVLIGGVVD
jgi:CHAT domain-containing protein